MIDLPEQASKIARAIRWDSSRGRYEINSADHIGPSHAARRHGRLLDAIVTVEVSPGHGETFVVDLARYKRAKNGKLREPLAYEG